MLIDNVTSTGTDFVLGAYPAGGPTCVLICRSMDSVLYTEKDIEFASTGIGFPI